MYKLEDFISDTLQGIVNGVEDARSKIKDKGAEVVTYLYGVASPPKDQLMDSRNLVQKIEFDVALTVEEGTKTAGVVGVVTGIFGMASKGESKAENSSLHRIKFSIPIKFKYDPKSG